MWITTNCGKFLEMEIPDHLTCLLRNCMQVSGNLDMEQQTDSKSGKRVHQGCILSPCLFNFYAEYIMWNARLYESQAGIKTARRNSKNLRYVDDTIMAEIKGELKRVLMRWKESEKASLKHNIQETKIMTSGPITPWQIEGEKVETVKNFFLGLQNHNGRWLQPWI